MAIAHDTDSKTHTEAAEKKELTWSHTVGEGANRLLVVGVGVRGNKEIESVEFNGVALTKLEAKEQGVNVRASLWYLKEPTTGTHTVKVVLKESGNWSAGASSFTGVDQTTPFGTVVTGVNAGSTTPSVTASSAAGEFVIDVLATKNSEFTLTVGEGQTENFKEKSGNATASLNAWAASSRENGASEVVMSWTISSSTPWVAIAVPIKPVEEAKKRRRFSMVA